MERILVVQYYRYAAVPDVPAEVAAQRLLCEELGVLGRIYVAPEGINGTLAGAPEAVRQYEAHLDAHPLFGGIIWKRDTCDELPFRKLTVKAKAEIVAFDPQKPLLDEQAAGPYVEPEAFQKMLSQESSEVVILDARSRYETELGRFKGAISLDIENFRELPDRLEDLTPYRDKTIVTYCTGGVKCEKVSAWLKQEGFSDVRQLKGGILHYAEQTGGQDFEGRCYVFDDRVAIDVNQVNPKLLATCVRCGGPADRSINCANEACHKRVSICSRCAEAHAGTCSDACYEHPRRRPWDGTGRYERGSLPLSFESQ